MKSNLSLSLNPKQLLAVIARYRKLVVSIAIVGLVGYTAYQISQITAVQVDQGYISTKSKESAVVNLKVNKDTLQQLKDLRPAGQSSVPVNVGKHDPFSL